MPFIGIILMEQGEFGGSIAEFGHRNYTAEAFALFGLISFITYKAVGRILPPLRNSFFVKINVDRLRKGLFISVLVLGLASFVMVVFFGGINTILGNVERGAFRSNLGPFGSIAYFILKFLAPGILAISLIFAKNVKLRIKDTALIMVLFLLSSLIALSFGFKSGLIILILPSLILIINKVSMKFVLTLTSIFFLFIFFSYYFFESLDDNSSEFIISLLISRLTIVQGAVPWKMWEMLTSGEIFPSYINTLPAVFGDKFLSFTTGISASSNAYEWVMMHSALIPTYLSGYSADEIVDGHNNTATSFSEGILFAGYSGILLFSLFSGLIIRVSIYWVEKAISRAHYASASVAACFAINCVWAWVMSGGINMIFHISVLVNFATLYILLRLIFEYGSNKSVIHRR